MHVRFGANWPSVQRSGKIAFMRFVKFSLLILAVCLVGRPIWSTVQTTAWSRAIERQGSVGPGAVVDFTRIGPSGWDRVFIFHPYTPTESIHESLGFHWPDAERTSIHDSDGVNLVVFVKGQKVVGWFEHPRGRGDFVGIANRVGYSRDEAQFTADFDRENRLVMLPR